MSPIAQNMFLTSTPFEKNLWRQKLNRVTNFVLYALFPVVIRNYWAISDYLQDISFPKRPVHEYDKPCGFYLWVFDITSGTYLINAGRIILYKTVENITFHSRKDFKFGKLSKNAMLFTNTLKCGLPKIWS